VADQNVHVLPTPDAMGEAAARHVASLIAGAVEDHGRARMLFAAAPSQTPLLNALRAQDIDWPKIEALHIDEYVGLAPGDSRGFGAWLGRALFDHVPIGAVQYIDATAVDAVAEARRYAALTSEAPIDIACIGIGVNGHIAFNEPYQWQIEGGDLVGVVDLHETSRQQQVDDECFATLDEVPTQALSLTVPALLAARHIVVTVPGRHKAAAVRAALEPGVRPECPATALQSHADVGYFVDRAAYSGTDAISEETS